MTHRMSLVLTTLFVISGCAHGASTTSSDPSGQSQRASGNVRGSYASDASNGDEDAFTRRFVAEIGRRIPEAGCVYAGERTVECGGALISLDRVWHFCLANGDECNAAGDDFAGGMVDALRDRAMPTQASVEQLRVAVRTSSYGDTVRRNIEGPVIRAVAEGLVAIVMVDFPTTARSYGSNDREALGLTDDDAYARALGNTLAELPTIPRDASLACGQVAAIQNDYYYESSRLLDTDWLAAIAGAQGRASTTLLVSAPSYDMLLVGPECDPGAVIAMTGVSTQAAAASQTPLSTTIFRFTATGLAPVR